MQSIKKRLDNLVYDLFGLKNLSYNLEVKPGFGDLSTNLAFAAAGKISGKQGGNPRKIAEKIKNNISLSGLIKEVTIAGAGFLNFKLDGKAILKALAEEDFSIQRAPTKTRKTQVEFISANPTGPLTLGNGRGGFYGDAIANLLERVGEQVEREYYINNMGKQIEELGKSVIKIKDKNKGIKTRIKNQKLYSGRYIDELAREINFDDNPSAVGKKAAEMILRKYIQPTIKKLGIRYNHWQSEEDLYKRYNIEKEVDNLRSQDVFYEKRGALWFKSTKYGDDKDRVVRRKTGRWTYLASDMLYLLDRRRRGFDKIIMIWGADHHGYIKRYLALAQALGWRKNQIKIIISQLARLKDKGRSLKISKRQGNLIYLEDLVSKTGVDAARWFFLMKNPSTHLDFDAEKALKKDLTNPVFYVQYGYVRAGSILKQLKSADKKVIVNSEISLIQKELALKLLSLPAALLDIYQSLAICKLPHLALDLAKIFQQFYEKERVLDQGKVVASRLLLVKKTKQALGLLLDLMGIEKPEKM